MLDWSRVWMLMVVMLVSARAFAEEPVLDQNHLEAAQALRQTADQYDQDFQTQLQVAWLYFQGGAYADALTYYQRADAIAGTPGVARLGIGWSHLRLDERALAREAFTSYLDKNPQNPQTAVEGLALAQEPPPPSWRFVVTATPLSFLEYLDNPQRTSGIGAGVAFSGTREWISISAAYAYHRFELNGLGTNTAIRATTLGKRNGANAGTGQNAGAGSNAGAMNAENSGGTSYNEHTVFASLGVGSKQFGASVDSALATDIPKIRAWAAGGTLRYSARNHLRIGGLYGQIQNAELMQGNVSYDIPLYDLWWLTPAGVIQFPPDTSVTGAGKLEISYRGPITLFLAGRFGRTFHEIDLIAPAISSHEDDVIWGGAAGVTTRFAKTWGLGGNLGWEHYEQHTTQEPSAGIFGKLFLIKYLGGDSK